MKKITAIFLLAVFMVSSTEAHELLKLPFLFHHYIEHRTKNAEIGVLAFLKLHYSQANNNDNDEDEDMKLPFKVASDLTIYNFVPSVRQVDTKPVYGEPGTSFSIFQNKLIPSKIVFSVFRPPRA